MNQRYPAVVLAIVVCIPLARGQTTGIITGDRVNLRSRPGPKGEVVAQLSKNTRVRVRSVQGDWLEVVPPQSVDLWVHSAFVSNGVVTVRTLNVRAGPSINYWVVGRLQKGDPVEVRGRAGEWLKIAPPEVCSLWVNRRYVKLATRRWIPRRRERTPPKVSRSRSTLRPTTVATYRPPVQTAASRKTGSTVKARRVELPASWRLVPLEGQGKRVKRSGSIRRIPFMLGAPTRYKLVERSGDAVRMVCYLWGDDGQLARFSGAELSISGREYWLRNHRYPVVVVETIELPPGWRSVGGGGM